MEQNFRAFEERGRTKVVTLFFFFFYTGKTKLIGLLFVPVNPVTQVHV